MSHNVHERDPARRSRFRLVPSRAAIILALAVVVSVSTGIILARAKRAGDHREATLTYVASEHPRVLRAAFVIIRGSTRSEKPIDRDHYDRVFLTAATVIQRESFNHLQLKYTIDEKDASSVGMPDVSYGARKFKDWYAALRPYVRDNVDIIGFGPDRNVDWCTDAHSMGFVIGGTRFICLEPDEVKVSADLVIHKLFHTFGFFHQQARNKQYRLLNWEIGLPGFAYAMDVLPAEAPDAGSLANVSFFSPMALAAVGVPRTGFEQCGLDGSLSCTPGDVPWECRDVVGPSCRDADQDGLIDSEDGYPLTPVGGGSDVDYDGIPDRLDLCAGPVIKLHAPGLQGGPMNYWVTGRQAVSLTASIEGGTIDESAWAAPAWSVDKVSGEQLYFSDDSETRRKGASIEIPRQRDWPVRIRLAYRYQGRPVHRTAYIYAKVDVTAPGPWAYVNEKEWFYFNRFGCDMPDGIDLYETPRYDADANGLPDANVSPFPLERLSGYDWDDDAFPDREDTLPTVAGKCVNHAARGVKDSDGDGLCDPGHLSYEPTPAAVPRTSYFGEMMIEMGNDSTFDRCPFLPGPAENGGCPARADGLPWYADAFPPQPR